MRQTNNLRVEKAQPLSPPSSMLEEFALGEAGSETVAKARDEIRDIMAGHDNRLLVVVGPCSIHDLDAAREYAEFIADMRAQHSAKLMLLMRVYFEKPRTSTGWKGLLNDPRLDGTSDIQTGLKTGRSLLVDLAGRGIPTASEVLDPIAPQYLGDAISWAAIGARTIESQTHREMASGLSMPVGLKNGTDGSFEGAVNAMKSARTPHSFLGIDPQGRVATVETKGNPDTHLVLRGGTAGPNHDRAAVGAAGSLLAEKGLCARVMVDCSHGNSRKDYTKQPQVAADVASQVKEGGPILGLMIESNLVAGKQAFPAPQGTPLTYGQSITDGCVDRPTTAAMLENLAASI